MTQQNPFHLGLKIDQVIDEAEKNGTFDQKLDGLRPDQIEAITDRLRVGVENLSKGLQNRLCPNGRGPIDRWRRRRYDADHERCASLDRLLQEARDAEHQIFDDTARAFENRNQHLIENGDGNQDQELRMPKPLTNKEPPIDAFSIEQERQYLDELKRHSPKLFAERVHSHVGAVGTCIVHMHGGTMLDPNDVFQRIELARGYLQELARLKAEKSDAFKDPPFVDVPRELRLLQHYEDEAQYLYWQGDRPFAWDQ